MQSESNVLDFSIIDKSFLAGLQRQSVFHKFLFAFPEDLLVSLNIKDKFKSFSLFLQTF
jgi:hypothetical protein